MPRGDKPKYYGRSKELMRDLLVCECGHTFGAHAEMVCCVCGCEVYPEELIAALQWISVDLLRSPINWKSDYSLSRIFGIIWGWSDEEWVEIAQKWNWDTVAVNRIKRLHKAYQVSMRRGAL